MRYLLSLTFILSLKFAFAQYTVESVPNQKLINGSYVSNPDGIVSQNTVAQIDSLLSALEKKTSAQVAVVLINSIGDDDIFDFAQRLFKTWGIGEATKDNGLLLLMVMDKRTVRFHTGFGLEGVLPDVVCKRIQRDFMVPSFKEGNYDEGILAGLNEVNKILTDPTYAEELRKPDESETSDWTGFVIFLSVFCAPLLLIIFIIKATGGKFSDSKSPRHNAYPEMALAKKEWLIIFVFIPVAIVITYGVSQIQDPVVACLFTLYFYFMATLIYRIVRMRKVIKRFLKTKNYYKIVEFVRSGQWYWLGIAILFPLPFLFYFFYYLTLKSHYRNHPRNCSICNGKMRKLSEKSEDQFLSRAQQLEETLHSIDYDVWQCESCQATEEWSYQKRSSKYKQCPFCNTKAYYRSSSRTVESPTYTSSGLGEEVHTCKFCGKSKTSTYTIAMLVASTSDSSSSSSSDSGGSWGGGDSGGGGASSSW